MNTRPVSTMIPDINDSHALGALTARVESLLAEPPRALALKQSLLDRVRASVAAHEEYTTIRLEDGIWVSGDEGVQRRVLRSDSGVRVEIQRLGIGAVLAWPEDADAQEILLVEGSLAGMQGTATATGVPGALGYCVRRRATCEDVLTATVDSTLYVRHRLTTAPKLPPLEVHWWQLAVTPPIWLDPGRMRWRASSEGVDVLPLCGNSDVVSMLVRFRAGASVPDHGHAIDEDCLILRGEMFLGDILLRAGDYQLAPAGGTHFNETSDVGVLFFFHGAVDPVLRGVPGRL